MEYIYGAMLLHSSGAKVTEEGLKKVLKAAGVKAEKARIKAVVSSLEDVDIDQAIKEASFSAPVGGGAPSAQSSGGAEKEEEKEDEEEEEEEASEEDAVSGLGALFG